MLGRARGGRGRQRLAAAVEGELIIREGEEIVRRQPLHVRSEINQAVSDRDELAEVIGQLASQSLAGIEERIRTIAQTP